MRRSSGHLFLTWITSDAPGCITYSLAPDGFITTHRQARVGIAVIHRQFINSSKLDHDFSGFESLHLKFNTRKSSFIVSSIYPAWTHYVFVHRWIWRTYRLHLISQRPVRHLPGFQRTWIGDKNSSPSGGRNRVSWISSTRHLPNSLPWSLAWSPHHIIIPQSPLQRNHKRSDILRSLSHIIQYLNRNTSTLNPGYSSP